MALQAPSLSNKFFFCGSCRGCHLLLFFFIFNPLQTAARVRRALLSYPPSMCSAYWRGLNMAMSLWHCHFEYIITTSLLGTSIPCIKVARSIPLKGRTPFFQGGIIPKCLVQAGVNCLSVCICGVTTAQTTRTRVHVLLTSEMYLNIYLTHTFKDFNKAKVFRLCNITQKEFVHII